MDFIKKIFIFLSIFLSALCAFSQTSKTDAEIKNYLITNGFACFTFLSDGTYIYSQHGFGESLSGSGTYSIKNGIIIFETLGKHFGTPVYGNSYNEQIQLPGYYKIDFEIQNMHYQGALINIDNPDMVLWSLKPSESKFIESGKTTIDGIECIKFPEETPGNPDVKYIVLLENLKLRSKPSTSASLVTVDFCHNRAGYSYTPRSIEFAGEICVVLAQTTASSTIDGITSPWYLIQAGAPDDVGRGIKEAWIFGGYVKEFKSKDLEEMKQKYLPLLRQSLKKSGGTLFD